MSGGIVQIAQVGYGFYKPVTELENSDGQRDLGDRAATVCAVMAISEPPEMTSPSMPGQRSFPTILIVNL